MGNAQATMTQQTLADYTSYMNNVAATIVNNSTSNCTAANTLNLETGGGPDNCIFSAYNSTININQTANASCKLTATNINSIAQSISNTIQNSVQQFIDNNLQSKQGWFSTAFSLQISGAQTSDQVATIVANNFSNNVQNLCGSQVSAMNNSQVLLCGAYNLSTINITQDATISSIVSCINQNTINVFTTNATLNQLWQTTDQILASQQEGASSIFKWLIVVVVVVVVAFVGVVVFKLVWDSKHPPPPSPAGSIPSGGSTSGGSSSSTLQSLLPLAMLL